MIKNIKIKLSMLFCLIISLLTSTYISLAAAANVEDKNLVVFENLSYSLFGNVEVKSSEFLYSLGDSPDFVCINIVLNL